jgi:ribulose-phosphate 3-epimerase
MIDERGLNILIQVDGGVGPENARQLVDSGVNVLVAGNSVFSAGNPVEIIKKLKTLV